MFALAGFEDWPLSIDTGKSELETFVLVGKLMQKFDCGVVKGDVKEAIYFYRAISISIHVY